ncbi:LAMI_0H04236g1_1 [Lachancea mirantina]|uniref:LAMI_0H04236g1_1 n=1 Tax=Lachancea mirantina TaxID=1230905 RepID=A0A1G4KEJ2_9SACH|nr:LAMI_0H04236g1_1 [Lachancea mirantina]
MVNQGNRPATESTSVDMELSPTLSSKSGDPQPYEGADDVKASAPEMDSNRIEQVMSHNAIEDKTETPDTLKREGLDLRKKALPDFNNPAMNADQSEFPEEYQIETDTGLVKVKTLQKLNRLESRGSAASASKPSSPSKAADADAADEEEQKSPYDASKLQKAIHKNEKEINMYHHHHGYEKFINIMDKLFK